MHGSDSDRSAGTPKSPSCPRVSYAVVHNDTVVREGVPCLLPDLNHLGSFASAEELLAVSPQVDVVLLGLQFRIAGLHRVLERVDAVSAIVNQGYRVCIYTSEQRRLLLVRCLAAGALGIVHTSESVTAVAEAVIAVANGEVVITRSLAGLAELAQGRDQLPELTIRQQQVLAARARGESFRSISRRLYISEKTAQEHMALVGNKFAAYLRNHSAADLERALGLECSEHVDFDPEQTLPYQGW